MSLDPNYLEDVRIISERWDGEDSKRLALHPNHEYRIRSDLKRLIEIITKQHHIIAEAGIVIPAPVLVETPSINRFNGKIVCTCGKWFIDQFCPVHRKDPNSKEGVEGDNRRRFTEGFRYGRRPNKGLRPNPKINPG